MVGMIWKHENPKASLRIHTTGSITIAGGKSFSIYIFIERTRINA